MNNIHDNMSRSERLLRGMGSIFGAIANAFTSPAPPSSATPPSRSEASSASSSQPPSSPFKTSQNEDLFGKNSKQQQQSSDSVLSVLSEEEKQIYEDTEKDLDTMLDMVRELKGMATAMGAEIDAQTKDIDALHDSVDRANGRLRNNIVKIRKI